MLMLLIFVFLPYGLTADLFSTEDVNNIPYYQSDDVILLREEKRYLVDKWSHYLGKNWTNRVLYSLVKRLGQLRFISENLEDNISSEMNNSIAKDMSDIIKMEGCLFSFPPPLVNETFDFYTRIRENYHIIPNVNFSYLESYLLTGASVEHYAGKHWTNSLNDSLNERLEWLGSVSENLKHNVSPEFENRRTKEMRDIREMKEYLLTLSPSLVNETVEFYNQIRDYYHNQYYDIPYHHDISHYVNNNNDILLQEEKRYGVAKGTHYLGKKWTDRLLHSLDKRVVQLSFILENLEDNISSEMNNSIAKAMSDIIKMERYLWFIPPPLVNETFDFYNQIRENYHIVPNVNFSYLESYLLTGTSVKHYVGKSWTDSLNDSLNERLDWLGSENLKHNASPDFENRRTKEMRDIKEAEEYLLSLPPSLVNEAVGFYNEIRDYYYNHHYNIPYHHNISHFQSDDGILLQEEYLLPLPPSLVHETVGFYNIDHFQSDDGILQEEEKRNVHPNNHYYTRSEETRDNIGEWTDARDDPNNNKDNPSEGRSRIDILIASHLSQGNVDKGTYFREYPNNDLSEASAEYYVVKKWIDSLLYSLDKRLCQLKFILENLKYNIDAELENRITEDMRDIMQMEEYLVSFPLLLLNETFDFYNQIRENYNTEHRVGKKWTYSLIDSLEYLLSLPPPLVSETVDFYNQIRDNYHYPRSGEEKRHDNKGTHFRYYPNNDIIRPGEERYDNKGTHFRYYPNNRYTHSPKEKRLHGDQGTFVRDQLNIDPNIYHDTLSRKVNTHDAEKGTISSDYSNIDKSISYNYGSNNRNLLSWKENRYDFYKRIANYRYQNKDHDIRLRKNIHIGKPTRDYDDRNKDRDVRLLEENEFYDNKVIGKPLDSLEENINYVHDLGSDSNNENIDCLNTEYLSSLSHIFRNIADLLSSTEKTENFQNMVFLKDNDFFDSLCSTFRKMGPVLCNRDNTDYKPEKGEDLTREEPYESGEQTDESPEQTDESPEQTDESPEQTDESPEQTDESYDPQRELMTEGKPERKLNERNFVRKTIPRGGRRKSRKETKLKAKLKEQTPEVKGKLKALVHKMKILEQIVTTEVKDRREHEKRQLRVRKTIRKRRTKRKLKEVTRKRMARKERKNAEISEREKILARIKAEKMRDRKIYRNLKETANRNKDRDVRSYDHRNYHTHVHSLEKNNTYKLIQNHDTDVRSPEKNNTYKQMGGHEYQNNDTVVRSSKKNEGNLFATKTEPEINPLQKLLWSLKRKRTAIAETQSRLDVQKKITLQRLLQKMFRSGEKAATKKNG